MAFTTLSVRVDEQEKKLFDAFCDRTGVNTSVAINAFVRKVLQEQRFPFTVESDPFYSPENMTRLRKSVAQMEATGGTIHEVPECE